jgi:hypothetical protein
LTYPAIAEKVGISRATLSRWRDKPEFAARVTEHMEEFRELVRRRGVARMERRLDALNDRWNRMRQVIDDRAIDPKMQAVPGGTTGLIAHNIKGVGRGEDFQLVDVYEVDTGLLRELREHEKQAAQELGQWLEKREITGDDKAPVIVKVLKGVSLDNLR